MIILAAIIVLIAMINVDVSLGQIREQLRSVSYELGEANRLRREKR